MILEQRMIEANGDFFSGEIKKNFQQRKEEVY